MPIRINYRCQVSGFRCQQTEIRISRASLRAGLIRAVTKANLLLILVIYPLTDT